jgi:hypothetical protein
VADLKSIRERRVRVPAAAVASAGAGSAGAAAAGGGELQRVKKLHGKPNIAQRSNLLCSGPRTGNQPLHLWKEGWMEFNRMRKKATKATNQLKFLGVSLKQCILDQFECKMGAE